MFAPVWGSMSSTSASGRLFDQKGELACPSSKRVQTGEPKFPNISCVWFHTKLRDETTLWGLLWDAIETSLELRSTYGVKVIKLHSHRRG